MVDLVDLIGDLVGSRLLPRLRRVGLAAIEEDFEEWSGNLWHRPLSRDSSAVASATSWVACLWRLRGCKPKRLEHGAV